MNFIRIRKKVYSNPDFYDNKIYDFATSFSKLNVATKEKKQTNWTKFSSFWNKNEKIKAVKSMSFNHIFNAKSHIVRRNCAIIYLLANGTAVHNHSLLLFFFFLFWIVHMLLLLLFSNTHTHTQCIFFECNIHFFFNSLVFNHTPPNIKKNIIMKKKKKKKYRRINLFMQKWMNRMRKKNTHSMGKNHCYIKEQKKNFNFWLQKHLFFQVSKKNPKFLFI